MPNRERAARDLEAMRADPDSDWDDRLLAQMAVTRSDKLSPRELLCVTAASHGLREIEIATILGRSPATVKSELASARRAMAAKNTAHLVALALRAGLIR